MRYLLVLTVVFSTVALAAMDTHLEGEPDCSGVSNFAGAKDVLVDHLTPTDQVQGISMYGPNDWWCAIDWSPSGGDCTWNEWAFHYIALGAHPYDLNIEVFDTDLNTTPIDSFTIPEGDITVTDTGMTAFGYTIWICEMDISCAVDFLDGGYYWIAQTFDATDNIFWVVWYVILDDYIYFYDGSGWHSAPDFFGENFDGSYAIGGTMTAVESASLGEIKAAFK